MRAPVELLLCLLAVLPACSDENTIVTFPLAGGPPAVPGSPAVTVVSPAQVDLSWTASSNATANTLYWIERDGTPVGFTSQLSFQDVGLAPNATYSYVLFAQEPSVGYSGPSSATLASTPGDALAPTQPAELIGLFEGLKNGLHEVRLEWTPSTDDGFVAGYKVLRDGTQIATTVASFYLDSNFLSNVQHCYEVIPFDTAGNQPPSGPRACIHTAWELDSITTSSALGRNAAIVVSTMNQIDVVHCDGGGIGAGSGLIVNSTWDGLGWANDLILVDRLFESSFDIAYDVNLDLHLAALRRGVNLGLVHAHRKDGVWSAELVDAQGVTGIEPRIAVGHDLRAHIAEINVFGAVRYGHGADDDWDVQTAAGPGSVEAAGALVLSPGGDAHFCFGIKGLGLLGHAWFDGEGWRYEVVADGVKSQVPPAAALDDDGTLHVVFESQQGRIRHAYGRPGQIFTLEGVSPLNVLARKPDLTRTPDGALHVVFLDEGGEAVRYANNSQGFWSNVIVDDAPSLGDRLSIDSGTDGTLAIAYRASGTLRVARHL